MHPQYNVKKLHGGKIRPFFAEGSEESISNFDEIRKVMNAEAPEIIEAGNLNDTSMQDS